MKLFVQERYFQILHMSTLPAPFHYRDTKCTKQFLRGLCARNTWRGGHSSAMGYIAGNPSFASLLREKYKNSPFLVLDPTDVDEAARFSLTDTAHQFLRDYKDEALALLSRMDPAAAQPAVDVLEPLRQAIASPVAECDGVATVELPARVWESLRMQVES